MSSWKIDAREYGRHVTKGGWWDAYLAARRVKEGNGNGGDRKSDQWDNRPTDPEAICSLRAFAKEAGTSHHRVMRHLEAWDRATAAGLVPPRSTFVGTEHNVPMPDEDDEPFAHHYTAVSSVAPQIKGDRRAAIIAAAGEKGASKALDVAQNPKAVIAAVKADPALAAAIAGDIEAGLAVSRERNKIERDKGARDPAELDRERERKRLAAGPTLVEVLELSAAGDKLTALAVKFRTPDDGHGEYKDSARVIIETAIAKIREAVQHIEDVMNGAVDTRIPDDIASLVSE